MSARSGACLVALLALVLAAPAGAATTVKRYSPWTGDGDPTVKRYFHGTGECTEASRVNPRPDAWRCVSGTVVLDPCFLSPTDDEVFCATAPWARPGHLLSAVLEPDDHGTSAARGPWALVVKKRRCVSTGKRKRGAPTYRCGRRGPFLFGRPNTRKKTWTIKLARKKKGARKKRTKIRTAWN